MSKKLTPQGSIESEKNIDDKKVRTPILTQNLSGAKVNPQGYLYKEEEIDGTIGYIPVVSIEGSGGGGVAVTSVNGKTGDVVLAATDVGAEPSFTKNTAFNKNFGTTAGTVAQGSNLVNADWNASSGLASINNKPTLISQQDIDDSIKAIEIGGRNYILNSLDIKNTDDTYDYQLSLDLSEFKMLSGKKVMIQFKANTDVTGKRLDCYFRSNAQVEGSVMPVVTLNENTQTYYWETVIPAISESATSISFRFRANLYSGGVNVPNPGIAFIKEVKIELGNKATDWSPAPEDLLLTNTIDYEKGVWTPVLLGDTTPGALTYTVKLGSYVRIGNQVTVFCYVRGTIQTKPTGALIVAGLPFNSEYAPEHIYPAIPQIGFAKSSIAKYCYTGRGMNYANKISFGKEVLNGNLNALNWTDLGDSEFQIHFQLTYIKL